MKNRAKCKLCGDIIESFHDQDYVNCKCGQISVYGGDKQLCASVDWNNFLRVDDEGNEIIVKVEDKQKETDPITIVAKPKREDLLKELQMMIEECDRLPEMAFTQHVSQYDLYRALMIIKTILEAKE